MRSHPTFPIACRDAHVQDVVGPVERLRPGDADDVRRMERDAERLAKDKRSEDGRPESAPHERDREVFPESPRLVLPAAEQPEAVDDPDDSVPEVPDHDPEHHREGQREHERRIELVVTGGAKHVDEHLERPERPRVLQLDGRLHGGFRVACGDLELGNQEVRFPFQPLFHLGEDRGRDPPIHEERVIRHREPQGRLRFLDLGFEMGPRGDEEARVPLSEGREPLLDLHGPRLPPLLLGPEVGQEIARTPLARRNREVRESALCEELPHRGRRCLDDKDR